MANLAVPSPRTWVVGEYETAAFFNANVRDMGNFLLNAPIALLYTSGAPSFSSGTFQAMGLDGTSWDTYGGHSNSTNNTRYTAQVAGFYMAFSTASWGPNATGNRGVALYKNGAAFGSPSSQTIVPSTNATNNVIIQAAGMTQLNVGDYVETFVYQGSGSSLACAAGQSGMAIMWIHA